MKLISWNVNGIRAVLKKGFLDFLDSSDPDIICIQETKAHPDQVEIDLEKYPHMYWSSAEKKGYYGTAVFSKIEPLNVKEGMGIEKHDNEGRILNLEFEGFFLVNVYTPNSKRGLERLEYRQKDWDRDFLKHLKKLEKKKPVILCGDLNVAHEEIDLARPKDNQRNAGFTDEEREGFSNIMTAGFIDTFREFEKDGGHYTWWSYMRRAREKNIGWRIDYFCISPLLLPGLNNAGIMPNVMGSDHAPITLEIDTKA